MEETPNYQLKKPTYEEWGDVEVLNENADIIDTELKRLEDEKASGTNLTELQNTVTKHLEQYEYQTATVSGTQIQLEKQSTSNRLLFKLESDLSGNITVSTDGGTTSKNLVDIDGAPVTSIEKGFHEIVLTGNFFILRNKGGLSTADLQALITIVNEAEANESVLRTNYVNAVNAADASINLPSGATWNDILLQIPNLSVGKVGFNTGVVTSGTTVAAGQLIANTNTANGYIIEGSLPFKPRIMLFLSTESGMSALYTTEQVHNYAQIEKHFIFAAVQASALQTSNIGFKADALGLFVNDTSFKLLVPNQKMSYTYYAFE